MKIIVFVFCSFFLFSACSFNQPKTLEDAFIRSLQKNNFELLSPYLPDRDFYNSVEEKEPARSRTQVDLSLVESRKRIKDEWESILNNVKEKKIDLSAVVLKEVLYFNPFTDNRVNEAMVINYEYQGKRWDDLQLIIGRVKNKICILSIPNPIRVFSMTDPECKATLEAKTWIDTHKPEFKQELEDLTDKIIKMVKENDLEQFGKLLVYRGPDETKRWKDTLNMNDSLDRKQASEFLQRANRLLKSCEQTGKKEIHTEKESEGIWIIMPIICGEKKISFAYLRINNQLLLGDVGVDE